MKYPGKKEEEIITFISVGCFDQHGNGNVLINTKEMLK